MGGARYRWNGIPLLCEEKEEEEEEENEDEANEDETVLTPSPLFLESCFFSSSPSYLAVLVCFCALRRTGNLAFPPRDLRIWQSLFPCLGVAQFMLQLLILSRAARAFNLGITAVCSSYPAVTGSSGSYHRKEQCRGRAARSNIGIVRVVRERLGYEMKPVLATNATATDQTLHRQGTGKLKHTDDKMKSEMLRVRGQERRKRCRPVDQAAGQSGDRETLPRTGTCKHG